MEVSIMSKQNRRKFDIGFKKDAVAQTEQGERTVQEVSLSLGIRPELLYRWRTQLRAQGPIAFPGNGKEALTDDQKRIRELEKKLRYAVAESFFHYTGKRNISFISNSKRWVKLRWNYSGTLRCITTEDENTVQMDLLRQQDWKNYFGIRRKLLN